VLCDFLHILSDGIKSGTGLLKKKEKAVKIEPVVDVGTSSIEVMMECLRFVLA
jgi:hypothetical protein